MHFKIIFTLSQIKREPTVHLWRTLKDCALRAQSACAWSWISQCLRMLVCSAYEAKTKGHYTQSHYSPQTIIPPKYWACKGGVLQSAFIARFAPKSFPNNKLGACNIFDPDGKCVRDGKDFPICQTLGLDTFREEGDMSKPWIYGQRTLRQWNLNQLRSCNFLW